MRCFDSKLRQLLAREAVGVAEGSLDPLDVGHGARDMAASVLLLVGRCVGGTVRRRASSVTRRFLDAQGRNVELLLLVCNNQTPTHMSFPDMFWL